MPRTTRTTNHSLRRKSQRPNPRIRKIGGENTTEETPLNKIIKRLKTNEIRISQVPDENWIAREALKEINEALIEFLESV